MAQQHCIQAQQSYSTLFKNQASMPSQNTAVHDNRTLPPETAQAIRLGLRTLGGFALAVCLSFWLHLLFV